MFYAHIHKELRMWGFILQICLTRSSKLLEWIQIFLHLLKILHFMAKNNLFLRQKSHHRAAWDILNLKQTSTCCNANTSVLIVTKKSSFEWKIAPVLHDVPAGGSDEASSWWGHDGLNGRHETEKQWILSNWTSLCSLKQSQYINTDEPNKYGGKNEINKHPKPSNVNKLWKFF